MDYHIEDITAFDNDNGSGIIARVVFHYETHLKSISVNVHIPLDKNASLAVIESRVFEEAKKQLKELAVEF
ncbi:hypothetical protein YA49_21765 [Enterobacter cloacae subsp. cloacae]|jgi:hypothetical protein|uniref:hypothetical protein n=1 Tax=Enterobacter cloacae complex TaxID=354276 RepID=UPI0004740820|nr:MULTISPECIES: hypothetical protein [Enterobacter cloacae complex]DAM38460.1 MAG TPA: hypothetical protein [Caudoviricetes sp.]HDS3784007.1 hypothetical protein [Enterobacter ludwigii]KLG03045.1 hypothetical protein YA49_21765 [Enterobacter cloacae subsp. cloacae]KLP50579.1 hypothetical protein ABF73_15215 [Enterobacter roggenkampii]OWS95178.1 hypothetical protein CEQ52_14130 [Enterobacter kobei]